MPLHSGTGSVDGIVVKFLSHLKFLRDLYAFNWLSHNETVKSEKFDCSLQCCRSVAFVSSIWLLSCRKVWFLVNTVLPLVIFHMDNIV